VYKLQNLNVVRIVETELEKNKLIKQGFLLLEEAEQKIEEVVKEEVAVEEEVKKVVKSKAE
jgi:hypothetical protein